MSLEVVTLEVVDPVTWDITLVDPAIELIEVVERGPAGPQGDAGAPGAGVLFGREMFAGDDVTSSFVLAHTFLAGSLVVFMDGILQKLGAAYTEKGDRTGFDYLAAPTSENEIEVRYAY